MSMNAIDSFNHGVSQMQQLYKSDVLEKEPGSNLPDPNKVQVWIFDHGWSSFPGDNSSEGFCGLLLSRGDPNPDGGDPGGETRSSRGVRSRVA